jgi:hypothetical protein
MSQGPIRAARAHDQADRAARDHALRAARCDLDLSAPFMPAPNSSDDFQEIMVPYAAIETGVGVEVRAIKKREALVRRVGEHSGARPRLGSDKVVVLQASHAQ